MIISGKATTESTQNYVVRHAGLNFSSLSDTGLVVSQAGFGSYRIMIGTESHHEAVRYALENGINLIDTSSNYADGGSEELVGAVIGDSVEAGQLKREELFIVSKVGYLQGENYLLAVQRKKDGRPFPNLVKYAQGLDHCIHPEFLEDQLTRSLKRLNLDCIDGYLLHNPEYYLSWADRVSIPLAEARQEYYRRIEMAFKQLEKEVADGRIQYYGISSNTFPAAANDPKFTSLTKVWEIAQAIDNHHFRIVQLPMNLLETAAIIEKNQPDGSSVLAFAREKGLAVLVNRPLNAIQNESLVRLADVLPPSYPAQPGEVSTAVDTCLRLEERFHADFLPNLEVDTETQKQLQEYLAVGLMLNGRWGSFGTFHNWRDVQAQFLLPRVQNALYFLTNQLKSPPGLAEWINGYTSAVNETLAAVSAFYQAQAAANGQALRGTAVLADPDWQTDTLSQTAVRALRSTHGITSVLVGMRRKLYIDDVLSELARPMTVLDRELSWGKLAQE